MANPKRNNLMSSYTGAHFDLADMDFDRTEAGMRLADLREAGDPESAGWSAKAFCRAFVDECAALSGPLPSEIYA